MSPYLAARRAASALILVMLLPSLAAAPPSAAPPAAPYQAILSMLDQMAAKEGAPSLRVEMEALVLGKDEGGKTTDLLLAAEKARIVSAFAAHYPDPSGYNLVDLETRPFFAIPAAADSSSSAYSAALSADDKAALAARDDSRFVIIVRIVDYHSGRYDLAETRSQLMDRSSGAKLALDVAWSSLSDGVESSLFIDGARVK